MSALVDALEDEVQSFEDEITTDAPVAIFLAHGRDVERLRRQLAIPARRVTPRLELHLARDLRGPRPR
jgi:hypothetical protein